MRITHRIAGRAACRGLLIATACLAMFTPSAAQTPEQSWWDAESAERVAAIEAYVEANNEAFCSKGFQVSFASTNSATCARPSWAGCSSISGRA